MDRQIFISYSRKDSEIVHPLVKEIEEQTGVKCWIDLKGIKGGDEFSPILASSIKSSDLFLFMYTKNSEVSKWTKQELHFAAKRHKHIVIVKLEEKEFDDWFEINYGLTDTININSSLDKQKLLSNIRSWFNISTPPTGKDKEPQRRGVNPPAGPQEPSSPKKKLPYFVQYVKWGSAIQVLIFAFIAFFMFSFHTPILGKGIIYYPTRYASYNLVYANIFLIVDLYAIIVCTLLLKKKNFLKWSFLVLDAIAIFLLFYICHNIYVRLKMEYTTESDRLLYALGYELRNGIGGGLKYFLPLYILHNACVLIVMYSRVIWYKLPYSIRRFTKRQIK